MAQLWAACSQSLRQRVSAPTWNAWLAPLVPVQLSDRTLFLAAPNSMVAEHVTSRLSDLLSHALAPLLPDDLAGGLPKVNVVVQAASPSSTPAFPAPPGRAAPPSEPAPQPNPANPKAPQLPAAASTPSTAPAPPQQPFAPPPPSSLSTPPNTRYTFEAFVIGASNRFAHAAALAVAERPARAYNPLFIYGDSGLGKTHLLQAIRHYVNQNFPALKVHYVSTETFLNEFIDAIHKKDQTDFKRRYRAYDVLLVDDIHFIENKKETQEEFFYTFNSLYEADKQVVLSSDRHPRAISTLEDRLRSRFESGLITDIQPPELETRLAILRKKAANDHIAFPEDVLELIATHVKDNIRELEGALTRLSAFASIHRVPVTRDLAEHVLSDVIAANAPRTITPQLILTTTAEAFGLTVDDICGPSRRRPLVTARQTAMYLFRHLLPDFSFPIIAKHFGDRDHTTVMHAEKKIEALMKDKPQVFEQVNDLIRKIRNG
ncbi:MAG: chromosomal replication initiator protein DnaA [Acidimicrobiales bacterium]